MQETQNSSVLAMEFHLYCINSSPPKKQKKNKKKKQLISP